MQSEIFPQVFQKLFTFLSKILHCSINTPILTNFKQAGSTEFKYQAKNEKKIANYSPVLKTDRHYNTAVFELISIICSKKYIFLYIKTQEYYASSIIKTYSIAHIHIKI